ncbi:ethyl acetate hydrolase-like [Glandiceps talaboti]
MSSLAEKRKHLHKEAKALLALTDKAKAPLLKLQISDVRRANLALVAIDGTKVTLDGSIRELTVPIDLSTDGIPVTVYRPSSCSDNPAILIYFHGGGFMIGSRQSVDSTCRIIAKDANCVVVNVEYRLAPEFKYPASIQDGVAVTRWILGNKNLVGGGKHSIVGVSGGSAGGTIAANICHEVLDLDFQILIYPVLDMLTEYPSHTAFGEGFALNNGTMEWIKKFTFTRPEDILNISVLKRDMESFKKQPPCLMIIADSDILCDECLAYAEKLKRAGCHVETLLLNGMIHGFYALPTLFKETCAHAHRRTTEFIKERVRQETKKQMPTGRL